MTDDVLKEPIQFPTTCAPCISESSTTPSDGECSIAEHGEPEPAVSDTYSGPACPEEDPNAHLQLTEMEKNVLQTRFEESKERVKKFNYHMDRLIRLGLDEFRGFQDTMDFAPRFRDHLVDAQLLVTNAHNFLVPIPPKQMVERILAKQKHDVEMAANGGEVTIKKQEATDGQ